jgi:hypothetical protein
VRRSARPAQRNNFCAYVARLRSRRAKAAVHVGRELRRE